MLATAGPLPVGTGWAYEFKWDGVRALATVRDGRLRLRARSGADITIAYPELAPLGRALADAVLDGEIVSLDVHGRPSFTTLAARTLGALLIGVPGPDGRLLFRGRVGGGISAAAERALLAELVPRKAPVSPFAAPLAREDSKDATWVRPEVVVEVKYGQRTPDG